MWGPTSRSHTGRVGDLDLMTGRQKAKVDGSFGVGRHLKWLKSNFLNATKWRRNPHLSIPGCPGTEWKDVNGEDELVISPYKWDIQENQPLIFNLSVLQMENPDKAGELTTLPLPSRD